MPILKNFTFENLMIDHPRNFYSSKISSYMYMVNNTRSECCRWNTYSNTIKVLNRMSWVRARNTEQMAQINFTACTMQEPRCTKSFCLKLISYVWLTDMQASTWSWPIQKNILNGLGSLELHVTLKMQKKKKNCNLHHFFRGLVYTHTIVNTLHACARGLL